MARTIAQLTVFVSSPGGLNQDRAAVESAVAEANRILAPEAISLSPFLWEKDAVPGRGQESAQDVINRKLEDDVDIFILFMHSRVGAATKNYVSGTVEEFEIVHKVIESGARRMEVCIYFNVSPVSPLVDIDQLKSVQEFRARVQALPYLTRDYEQAVDLRLSMVAHLVEKARSVVGGTDESRHEPVGPGRVQNLLDDLLATDDGEEALGPLDYEDIASKMMGEVGPLLEKMGDVVSSFSPLIVSHAEKLNKANELSALGISVDRKEMIDSFADMLESHNSEILPLVDEIESKLSPGSAASLGLMQEWPIETAEGAVTVREVLESIGEANLSMAGFAESIATLQVTLQDWPGPTQKLKKARKRAVALYSRLHSIVTDSVRILDNAVRIGEDRLLERAGEAKLDSQ